MKKLIIALLLLSPVAVFAQKFGHVDTQALLESLPEVVQVRSALEELSKQKEAELNAMQDEFMRKADEYDKKKSAMDENTRKKNEESLQEEYKRIQEAINANHQEIMKKQEEMQESVLKKVRTAIQNVGTAGQYTYIFETSAALFVGAGSKDLTNEIKAEFNRLK